MYAIIESGGKQYKVKAGDEITVELLGQEAGAQINFDRILGLFDGEKTTIGKPLVAGAKVTGTVMGDGKAKKVIIYKHKSKKGFHKKKGHRQPFTRVKIDSVSL